MKTQELFEAMDPIMRKANMDSHVFRAWDDCVRCIDCEIGVWSGWKEMCWNV